MLPPAGDLLPVIAAHPESSKPGTPGGILSLTPREGMRRRQGFELTAICCFTGFFTVSGGYPEFCFPGRSGAGFCCAPEGNEFSPTQIYTEERIRSFKALRSWAWVTALCSIMSL
jgi:hypothetical protein